MNRITQYVPGCVDGESVVPFSDAFSTVEELLALPWVAQWRNLPGCPFRRFSLSDGGRRLMAEYLAGQHKWWVVGHLEKPLEGLPEWEWSQR